MGNATEVREIKCHDANDPGCSRYAGPGPSNEFAVQSKELPEFKHLVNTFPLVHFLWFVFILDLDTRPVY